MDRYVIGDMHFNHTNIIKYCNRPWNSVEEMNEGLITNWNNVVHDEDIVFVNGDFCLGSHKNPQSIVDFGKRLKGHKILILGNHDLAPKQTYYDAGFETVTVYPLIVDEFYIISHYPQYIQNNGVYANIFAHVHDNPQYTDYSSRSFCTSVERIGYTPINFDEILAKMKGAENDN